MLDTFKGVTQVASHTAHLIKVWSGLFPSGFYSSLPIQLRSGYPTGTGVAVICDLIKNLPRSKPKQRNTTLRVQRLLTDGGCGKSGRGRCGKLV